MKVARIGCSEDLVPSPSRVLIYWSASAGFFAPARETTVATARYPEVLEGGTTASPSSEDFFAQIIDFQRSDTLKMSQSAKTGNTSIHTSPRK
jgi:hypothetical protein